MKTRYSILLSLSALACFPVTVHAQSVRPIHELHNEIRAGTTEFRIEKMPAPAAYTRRIADDFSMGDTLETTPNWHIVLLRNGDFSAPLRYPLARNIIGTTLYVQNIPGELTRYQDVEGLSSERIDAIADSLRTTVFNPEECVVGNALNSSQNCACYAFECVFRAHGIDPAPFFTWQTVIPEEAILPLLGHLLDLQRTLSIPRNTKKWVKELSFTQNAIYVCRDVEQRPIHLFFFRDGRFWSKNGGVFPHTSYNSLLPILKHYENTVEIEEYTLKPEFSGEEQLPVTSAPR